MTMVPGFVVVMGVGCGVPVEGIDGAVDGMFVSEVVVFSAAAAAARSEPVPAAIFDATAIPSMLLLFATLLSIVASQTLPSLTLR